jgi:hypothetical protein
VLAAVTTRSAPSRSPTATLYESSFAPAGGSGPVAKIDCEDGYATTAAVPSGANPRAANPQRTAHTDRREIIVLFTWCPIRRPLCAP